MAGMGSTDFVTSVKNDNKLGEVWNWKKEGKAVIFVHPIGFKPRHSVWLPTINDEGKTQNKRFNSPTIKGHCPIAEFRQFLRDNEDIEDDDVVFVVDGKPKIELTKGDVLGLKGYDWKNSLKGGKEYAMAVVDTDNIEGELQIIVAGAACSNAVSKAIRNQMEEEGEEKGDILKHPYALKLTYDEKESPNKMYDAFFHKHKLTEEIQALLESEAPDLDKFCEDDDPVEIWEHMQDSVTVEGFEPSILEMVQERTEPPKEKEKKESKPKKEKEEKKESKTEEKPSKPKKGRRKVVKQEEEKPKEEEKPADEDMDVCPACDGAIAWDAEQCPHCDAKFELETEEDNSSGDEGTEEKKKCPECEVELDADAKRCTSCGEKLK